MTSTPVTAERLAAWQRLRRPLRRGEPAPPDSAQPDRRRQAQADRLTRGVLRRVSLLDALLERDGRYDPRRTPRDVQWILRLAVYEKIYQAAIPDYAIGDQAVALARRVAGAPAARFVNATLRRLLPALPDSPEALASEPWLAGLEPDVRWSIPRPILDRLADGYGASILRSVLPALAEAEAPVWLRVNTLRAQPEALRAELAAEGIPTEPAAPPAEALLWRGGDRLPWESPAWDRGALTVQDLGSMLATSLLDPQPGEVVLDACAAPGGKTGHLWQRMAGRGRLVALEVDRLRRREMAVALERLFGPGHGIELPDCAALSDLPEGSLFDRVLLDAPCLALGLIGRHPEIRWDGRLRHAGRLIEQQRALLAAGAERVARGGRLAWVTCSPTRIENEEILTPWLAVHPDWRLADPKPLLDAGWADSIHVREGWVRTRPDRIPCDGFAMAMLERIGAS